jgi:hypothetical protein
MGMPRNIDLDLIQDYLSGEISSARRRQIELAMDSHYGLQDEVRALAEFRHRFQRARIALERGQAHQKHLEFIRSMQADVSAVDVDKELDDSFEDLRALEAALKSLIQKTKHQYSEHLQAIGLRMREIRLQLAKNKKQSVRTEISRMRLMQEMRYRIEGLLEAFEPRDSHSDPFSQASFSRSVYSDYVSPRITKGSVDEYLDIPHFLRGTDRENQDFFERWGFLEEKLSSSASTLGHRSLKEWAIFLRESVVENNEKGIARSSRDGYPLATLWLAEKEKDSAERNRLLAEAVKQLLEILSDPKN